MIDSIDGYIEKEIERLIHDKVSTSSESKDSVDKIVRILLSKRYRKSKVSEEQKTYLEEYISNSVSERKPIDIYLMTGGYKQPRLPSSPHIDWAEVFNIMYMFRFGKELATNYSGLVHITYRTHGAIVSILNDIPKENTDLYTDEFQGILDYFSENIKVSNLNITTKEAYSYQEALFRLDKLDLNDSYNISHKDIEKAKRNFINNEVSNDLAARSFLLNKRFLETDPFISQPFHTDKVCIYFRGVGASDRLSFGSTKSSDVQYWSGIGVLNTSKAGIPYMDIKGKKNIEKDNYTNVNTHVFPNYLGLEEILVSKK